MGFLKKTFINRTGRAVNDLHVIFSSTVTQVRPSPPSPFLRTWGIRTNVIHFDGSMVAEGRRVGPITFAGPEELEIADWWWTRDGRRIGRPHPRRKTSKRKRPLPSQLPLFDGGGPAGGAKAGGKPWSMTSQRGGSTPASMSTSM